ncbi:PAS domain-containing sensor histidine kinase [Salaquimonas pukyongi]|uniref:sensor histidine kinase n=1 Tax=Salaquimonas pukyongi TaxID=2712698 RepID=UPI00096B6C8C|nr:PAS domain-containing sensor histidine kinase [Salaquimonas pukyongi]
MRNTPSEEAAGKALDSLVEKFAQAEAFCREIGNPDLVQPATIHDHHGKLLWASSRAAAMLGLRQGEEAGHFLELVNVQDRIAVGQFLADAGAGHGKLEFRPLRQQANAAGWLEISAGGAGVECDTGASRFRVLAYRDVTQAKEAEAEAERLCDRAEHANIAKSRFLANMSHELRTPLNAILGFSELLKSPIAADFPDARKEEYICLIHDSASHLLDVLNGILDMSKIEHGMYEIQPQRFDLEKCLRTTAAIMRGQAETRSIAVNAINLEGLPEIVADEKAVRQIVINLLSNAIKFSPEGAVVTLQGERSARFATLIVQDAGIGISPEHIESLGQPFFQADSKHDRRYEGTGLGLSVVKGLVELHGGDVRFESRRDHGTTVTVRLPIHGAVTRPVASPSKVSRIKKAVNAPNGGDAEAGEEMTGEQLRILRNTA